MRGIRSIITIGWAFFSALAGNTQTIIANNASPNAWLLNTEVIYVDDKDFPAVKKSAELLQADIERVTGQRPGLVNEFPVNQDNIIVIGSLQRSALIKDLADRKKIDELTLRGKWEAYRLQSVSHPFPNIENALLVTGSDERGTAFGVMEISKLIGVSPWYWWADVPVKQQQKLFVKKQAVITDAPKVKYRGIFINDEAPALSNWSREKFGGFNHRFYEKVFELMLRLKANYLWPAMWGNAFYDDDSLNINAAMAYGIVIGTSHHEPLMRAHDEWRRYGSGKWNYDSNAARLQQFWRGGLQRAVNEKIVTIGMRGDGDEPMIRETATALLERIVQDQRAIIEEVTGQPPEKTPQLWALYKEVQDYYDKGMRVPDDVTLLLCDDNWGNIRKLPKLNEKPRQGGYGIYYHFDYVGGPRNYKWVNTNAITRVWEQMHLAWQYKARQIWIVNVGDIKPMEFPSSFFLDYAWNPTKIGAGDLQVYTEHWAAAQFGRPHAKAIANIISTYAKFSSRRKPEMLDAGTYSLHIYNEFGNVVRDYQKLLQKAEDLQQKLPAASHDAYFQLVLHPVKACANLHEMYYNAALNKWATGKNYASANRYAAIVKELYEKDSLITLEYHLLNNGKWNHMMSQTHIGYTYWQQPPFNTMPPVTYVPAGGAVEEPAVVDTTVRFYDGPVPAQDGKHRFYEFDRWVSIDASHFTRAINTKGITWKVLPDHGRTGSAITPFPVTAGVQKPGAGSPHVQYEFYSYSDDSLRLLAYFSPTLNFHNTQNGLQYAVSIDDEKPQVFSINKEDTTTGRGIWNKWVAENIIIKTSRHKINKPGKHTVKYWMVDPGVVLQKIVLDFGGLRPSYLGPPETTLHRSSKTSIK